MELPVQDRAGHPRAHFHDDGLLDGVSHLTNDDLVKESRLVRDYDIDISFEGEREGIPVWEFELVPKPEAPVVWGRIVYPGPAGRPSAGLGRGTTARTRL